MPKNHDHYTCTSELKPPLNYYSKGALAQRYKIYRVQCSRVLLLRVVGNFNILSLDCKSSPLYLLLHPTVSFCLLIALNKEGFWSYG